MDGESIGKAEPAAVAAVIFGASEFPYADALTANPAFAGSASAFTKYLKSEQGFRLEDAQVLNLFNDDGNVIEQNDRLTEHLICNQNASDLIIYYVGHGGFLPDREYFLALRSTKRGAEGVTGLRIRALAHSLEEHFPGKRVFLILDCCFAGEAVAQFQSGELAAIVENETFDALPAFGTSLLVAASKDEPAIAPTGAAFTMFSDCLLEVLGQGITNARSRLSLTEVGVVVQELVRGKFGQRGVRPEIHSPRQGSGDVAKIPLFPNPAYTPPEPKSLPPAIREALRNPLADIRHGAIKSLAQYLSSEDRELATLARAELERLAAKDDSRSVQQRAREVLGKRKAAAEVKPRPRTTETPSPRARAERAPPKRIAPRRALLATAAGLALLVLVVAVVWMSRDSIEDTERVTGPALEDTKQPSTPDVARPRVELDEARAEEKKRKDIGRLLASAEIDLKQDRLTGPKGNNAVERYRAVLALDPDNQIARAGLDRVVARLTVLADSALDAQELDKGEEYLAKAEGLGEGGAELASIRARLEKARAATQDNESVRRLLADAERHLQAGRLSVPKGKNAVESYQAVLVIDPGNQGARAGLERVAGKYTALADGAMAENKLDRAEGFLAKVEAITPADPELARARSRLEKARASDAKRKELERLIVSGDRRFREGRLDSPKGDNAVEDYQAVLALDPDNRAARAGLDRVVSRYLELASRSLAGQDLDQAADYLAKAEDIGPENPGLADVRARLEEARKTPSGLAFAVFPFQSLAICHYSVRDEVTDAADAVIRDQPRAKLEYSFYREGSDPKLIPGLHELWSDNAARREPKVDVVRNAGRRLGVNGVLMAWYKCSRSQHVSPDTYEVEVYLIDVDRDQVFHAKEMFLDADRATSKVFEQFFADYGIDSG